jgi:hypothetical protein
MAEQRKAAVVPATAVSTEPPKGSDVAERSNASLDDKDYDGQGNRLLAVRHEKVDAELVYNGLTSVPQVEQPKTDEHTDNWVAVAALELPEDPEFSQPKATTVRPGAKVEGLSDEQLRPLITSGAIRRETKDEAK